MKQHQVNAYILAFYPNEDADCDDITGDIVFDWEICSCHYHFDELCQKWNRYVRLGMKQTNTTKRLLNVFNTTIIQRQQGE